MSLEHVKISLSLPGVVHAAFEKEARERNVETTLLMQRALTKSAAQSGYLAAQDAQRQEEFWTLVKEAIAIARTLARSDGPHEDITRQTFETAERDTDWLRRYEAHIKGPARGKGNPRKGPINREIGFRIRQALDATVRKTPEGKVATAKVVDGIIQSYSPFAKINPNAPDLNLP